MPNVCRSCKQPVRWVILESGKRGPLDPEPVQDGNVVLNGGGRAVVLSGSELAHARQEGQALYRSHFASCPFADDHRKEK